MSTELSFLKIGSISILVGDDAGFGSSIKTNCDAGITSPLADRSRDRLRSTIQASFRFDASLRWTALFMVSAASMCRTVG
jgi:hypothetical protein